MLGALEISVNPTLAWFQDLWTCPFFPKQFIFIFGDPNIFQIIQEQSQIMFKKYCFYKSQNIGNSKFWKFGKSRRRTIPTINLKILLSCIRDQYFPKIMKLKFGNMKPLYFENLKGVWILETLKVWNQFWKGWMSK